MLQVIEVNVWYMWAISIVHVLRLLKEELVWATDKLFQVISSYVTKKLKNTVLYVLFCGP